MKKVLAVVLAMAMVFSFAACGKTEEPAATTETAATIKVGVTGPLTGGAAIYGQAVANGAEIAFAEINALGGIQFEFKAEDDEASAEKAYNAYNNLVDWGMQIMMGSVTSGSGETTSAEAQNDRYFWLTPSGSSTNVIEGKDCAFQMCFTDPNQGVGSADYIADNNLGTKIGIIWKNDDSYSTGIHDTFVKEAEVKGLTIVCDETFTETTQTDFSVQVKKCADAGCDLVFLPIYYTPAAAIFMEADKQGYTDVTWFGVDGMDGILTMDNFDTSLAEGVVVLTPYSADADTELNKNFVAAYQAAYGEVPNQFAADAYDCAYLIAQLVEEAGITADMSHEDMCEALRAQITQANFTGLTGTDMTWSASGEVSKMPNAVIIKDGTYVGM